MHENMKDSLERPLQDLRISVIDRCNFRCTYCMPAEVFGPDYAFLKEELLLTFDEIERLARLFISMGVNKIRLTGGEPLLRKDLPTLIARLAKLEGLKDIGLTTNGIHLAKQAKALKEAGLKRVLHLEEVQKRLQKSVLVQKTPYLLSFLIDEYRFVLFTDGRAFIHGTNDVKIAKRLYAKYIG